MVTRPLVKSGIPGPGQDRFPEQAREQGRRMGLVGSATILRYSNVGTSGAVKPVYTPDAGTVRARLEPAAGGVTGLRGDVQDEATTHVVTFDNGQSVSTKDRVQIEGLTWIITAMHQGTDELVRQIEVKEL